MRQRMVLMVLALVGMLGGCQTLDPSGAKYEKLLEGIDAVGTKVERVASATTQMTGNPGVKEITKLVPVADTTRELIGAGAGLLLLGFQEWRRIRSAGKKDEAQSALTQVALETNPSQLSQATREVITQATKA